MCEAYVYVVSVHIVYKNEKQNVSVHIMKEMMRVFIKEKRNSLSRLLLRFLISTNFVAM